MTAIHVQVTAEDIAAAAVVPDGGGDFQSSHPGGKDPVELAIGRVTGQDAMCDEDGPGTEIATIGQGTTTIVVSLPPEIAPWIERYYRGKPVEPFAFDIKIEDWLVALIRDGRPYLTLREAAAMLGVTAANLRQLIGRDASEGEASPRAHRLRPVRLGRDWFVERSAVEAEVAAHGTAAVL